MEIVVGAPKIVVSSLEPLEQDVGLAFHDLADLNVPAEEARVWVGHNDASITLVKAVLGESSLIAARDGDEVVVKVARLWRCLIGLSESSDLVQLVALHHLEAAVPAEENHIVNADLDGCWSSSEQRSAGSKSDDRSEAHCERRYQEQVEAERGCLYSWGVKLLFTYTGLILHRPPSYLRDLEA